MPSQKLPKVLEIITQNLIEKNIPYTLIGAFRIGIFAERFGQKNRILLLFNKAKGDSSNTEQLEL